MNEREKGKAMISIAEHVWLKKREEEEGDQREEDALLLSSELPHLDEVLSDLGDPLLALVNGEVWPIDELLFDLSISSSKYKQNRQLSRHLPKLLSHQAVRE
jgi:hypothetical protein